jgi:glycosyltransferase involved in cell wall biosynthesis
VSGPRLLLVTPRYLPLTGGVENHVYQVSRRLACLGLDVSILTADRGGRLPRREHVGGVQVLRVRAWPERRDYFFAPEMWRVIRKGAWDLIHLQSYHTLVAPLAMAAALRARIPYVVTFHGGGHSSRLRAALRRWQLAALRPLLARAERLIAVASFEIPQYSAQLGVRGERFALIPNGADLGGELSQPVHISDATLIVSVGRLERYKGHQRIISAMPAIVAQRPDVRLRIAGVGPYEPELRRLAERLGVAERVEIRAVPMHDRSGMAGLMAGAALVAVLSDYETHPIAALEALSLGRPVLVTATSGLQELADRGMARAIPLRSRPEEVAAAALRLLEQPAVACGLTLPTWDDCAAHLHTLYRAVLEAVPCAS